MKIPSLSLVVGLTFCAFHYTNAQQSEATEITKTNASTEKSDIAEIEALIRELYIWNAKGNPSSVGTIENDDHTQHIAFNLFELDQVTQELMKSNFFTTEFIGNFKKIHVAIDEKLKSKQLEWFTHSLAPFGSGTNEWCSCQDVPFDEPNPWSLIEIEKIKLTENSGEFYWKWGNIDPDTGSGWNSFKYHFKVEKVDGKWKVSYLEGFEFETFTRI